MPSSHILRRVAAQLWALPRGARVALVLTAGSLLILTVFTHVPVDEQFQGEVWGDLEAHGTIERFDRYDQFDIYDHNVDPTREEPAEFTITITGVGFMVLQNRAEFEGPTTNTSVGSASGVVNVTIGQGHVACRVWDAEVLTRYSEYRGQAYDEGPFSDPEYEIFTTVAEATVTGELRGDGIIDLSDAKVYVDGRRLYIRQGSINLSGEGPYGIRVFCEGGIDGQKYAGSTWNDDGVHIDGRLEIDDFRELSSGGGRGWHHERIVVEGGDIRLKTLESPYTWEHWYVNLEPWTVEITTEDKDDISSSNYTRALVLIFLMWSLTFIIFLMLKYNFGEITPRKVQAGSAHPIGGPLMSPQPAVRADAKDSETTPSVFRTTAPVFAGIICLANCGLVLVLTVTSSSYLNDEFCLVVGVFFPIIGMVGGTFAAMRKSFRMAVVGAIATMASPGVIILGPVCVPIPWVGLVALVLLFIGRSQFRRRVSVEERAEQARSGWRP